MSHIIDPNGNIVVGMPVMPDTPQSVLALMPDTAKQIHLFTDTLLEEVRQGGRNPLELNVQAAKLEKIAKILRDGTKAEALAEAEFYPEKEFIKYGVTITKRPTATTYDYSNDAKWVELREQLKAREEFLKALKMPVTVVDDVTGEIITVRPPEKKVTEGIVILMNF